jgi:CheY-like chemotaxis protein
VARILLVEDNEMNRDSLSRLLQRRGHEVVCAADGAIAVEMARQHMPEVILMDVGLPIIDGYEATRRIKADPATRTIPVIALTAQAMSSDRALAVEAGCDDYDTKPVDMQRLLGKITERLNAVGNSG